MPAVGPIGRLGRYTATHFRTVLVAWIVLVVVLGVFAPRVEHALSGAGWEATGSESVQARELVDRSFQGQGSYGLMAVVHSGSKTRSDAAFTQTVTAVRSKLGGDPAVTSLAPTLFSRDGHTAVVQAGAARNSNVMVRAADDLKKPLGALSRDGVQVDLTGA